MCVWGAGWGQSRCSSLLVFKCYKITAMSFSSQWLGNIYLTVLHITSLNIKCKSQIKKHMIEFLLKVTEIKMNVLPSLKILEI